MVDPLLESAALATLSLAGAGLLAHLLRLPPVVGYLGAGILLSPSLLGPAVLDPETLARLSQLGVLVLLFFIGLELDLVRLRRAAAATAWTVPFHTLVPLVLIAGIARLAGWSFAESLVLGAAVAVSSTLLGDRLSNAAGVLPATRQRVLGLLVVEDLVSGLLLAMVPLLVVGSRPGWPLAGEAIGLLIAIILLTAGALLVVPRLLDFVSRTHAHELLVLWGLGVVALFGYLGARYATPELGAFAAGVAAAEAGSRVVTRNSLQGLRDASVAVFFFASGLAVNLGPTLREPILLVGVLGAFLAGKFAVNTVAAIASGMNLGQSLRCAFAVGAVGEYGLILAAVAGRAGIAHPNLLATVVGAMVLTLPISAVLMANAQRIERGFWRLPRRLRNPVVWLGVALRQLRPAQEVDDGARKGAVRRLVANGLLLVALSVATPWLLAFSVRTLPLHETIVQVGVGAVVLAFGLPLLVSAYRGYHQLAWSVVGLREGERPGAGRIRMRFVDAAAAGTLTLLLVPVTVRLPVAWPVLAAAAAIAAVVAVVAWRRLVTFHGALEEAVRRVLGDEAQAGAVLDRVLADHPWGVRFAAVSVPAGSALAKQTLHDSRLLELTGSLVAVVQRKGVEIVNPDANERIQVGDTLVLLGDPGQLERAEALIVSHGEVLRMTAQSKLAHVEEVTVEPGSAWASRTLGSVDVRAATGALVVGVRLPGDQQRPRRYDPLLVLDVGSRVILMGTALQMERARRLASPQDSDPDDASHAAT